MSCSSLLPEAGAMLENICCSWYFQLCTLADATYSSILANVSFVVDVLRSLQQLTVGCVSPLHMLASELRSALPVAGSSCTA